MSGFRLRFSSILMFGVLAGAVAAADLPMTDKVDDLTRHAKPSGAKIILLNVWGQTCARCILEMPTISRAVTAMKDNADVAFVGLCIPDDDPSKNKTIITACSKIAEKKQVNYPNFIWSGDGDPLTAKFNITATPYNCLMNADGKILTELDIPEGDKEKAYAYLLDAISKALKDAAPKRQPQPAVAPIAVHKPQPQSEDQSAAQIILPPDEKPPANVTK